jgi:hypothetical protein
LAAERQLADRQALNEQWQQFLQMRLKLAGNAGFADYRAYRWKQMLRLDYTPQDCLQFRADRWLPPPHGLRKAPQRLVWPACVPALTDLYLLHFPLALAAALPI